MVFSLALSKELMDLAFVEKEFKNEYFRLAEQCRSFSVSLLGLCWSDAEVRIILNGNTIDTKRNSRYIKTGLSPQISLRRSNLAGKAKRQRLKGTTDSTDVTSTEPLRQRIFLSERESGYVFDIANEQDELPIRDLFTLKLASSVQNREFIAHPNCQHQLQKMWLKNCETIIFFGPAKFFIFFILLMLTIPLQVLVIWFFPNTKIGKMIRAPYFKFLTHTASYLVFLSLLSLSTSDKWLPESHGIRKHLMPNFRESGNLDILYRVLTV